MYKKYTYLDFIARIFGEGRVPAIGKIEEAGRPTKNNPLPLRGLPLIRGRAFVLVGGDCAIRDTFGGEILLHQVLV